MANRNSKLIERVLKDFSLNISTDGEGGAKVVTELPEVGDEHNIYELHTTTPSIISYWVYTNGEWVNIDEIPVPSTSLGVVYSNIRIDNPKVNNAVDIYYGEEKLEINDYYVFYPQTEEPQPSVAYATLSGLPLLNNETHDFVLTICPKMDVDTENDRLSISVNGINVYQSQWRQEIPLEITVIVEGISQIEIDVKQMEA